MKKLNYVKFSLDLIMALIFALLFNKMVLGILFHEAAGLAIGAVILVHCGLNWKWIKGVTLKLFNSKLPMKTRLGYIIDVLLLINVLVIIISGVLISKTLFPSLGLNGTPFLKFLHISSSYVSLMLIGIHLGFHWGWVMLTFKKIFKIPNKKIYTYISRVAVILVLAFGIYSANSVGYLSKVSFSSSPGVESKMKGEFKPNRGVESTNPPKGNFPGNPPKAKGGPGGNTSILNVITQQLGVISIFSIIAYYLEKLLNIRKKKIT